MTYRGHVKGGVVVFDPPASLPEGAEVTIEPIVTPDESSQDADHPFLKMLELAGPTGRPDLATNPSPDEIPLDIEGEPIHPAFLIGDLAIDTGIPDLGKNIDHYLYGHPKVEDEQ